MGKGGDDSYTKADSYEVRRGEARRGRKRGTMGNGDEVSLSKGGRPRPGVSDEIEAVTQ